MGDTFYDSWEDQVPSVWGDGDTWGFSSVRRSKAGVNTYSYWRKDGDGFSNDYAISFVSTDPHVMRLSGKVYISHLNEITGTKTDIELELDSEWNSIDAVMAHADNVFRKVMQQIENW